MRGGLAELARAFTRLGLTAFGGPAAHIAIMQHEFVERRRWLDERAFVDLLGLSSLLPGPTSTEVALGIGFRMARWRGLLVAGAGFIVPASLIVLAIAVVYAEAGSLGIGRDALTGMAPVVVGVVAHALLRLVPPAVTDAATLVVALGALVGSVVLLQPVLIVIAGALVLLVVRRLPAIVGGRTGALLPLVALPSVADVGRIGAAAATGAVTIGLGGIFLTFLKMGLVVFGSGYVLITFLGADLVEPGLISEQELLDAVAIGQVTPGPVFTTATFIGYLLAGVPGAIVATVAIFLPAIVLVGVAHPLMERIRGDASVGAAVEGLNAAAVGLVGGAVVLLARVALVPDGAVDALSVGLAVVAFAALLSGRVGPVPLLIGGGLVGLVAGLLR